MKRCPIIIGWLSLIVLCTASHAGIRGPGKYSGVVIFDRWGGCTLYSGIYVMYISEKAKQGLRPYSGQAVQIDAKEVSQPINPGDGLITQFKFLGAAPEGHRSWVKIDGIRLTSTVRIEPDGKPVATITIENTNGSAVKLLSQELALTLLTKRAEGDRWSVSDGPSFALITRQSFEIGSSEPRWKANGLQAGKPYAWTIGKESALPHDFMLGPKERKTIDVHFDLPDGQYDFLCGYGGGVHKSKCIASNLSAFDVENGKSRVANVRTR